VAHVENTVMDVYYRNDSMKSGRAVSWLLLLPKYGGWVRLTKSTYQAEEDERLGFFLYHAANPARSSCLARPPEAALGRAREWCL
jgi:hypothetical protein